MYNRGMNLELFVAGDPKAKGSMAAYARQRTDGSWYGSPTHSSKSKQWEAVIRDSLTLQLGVPGESWETMTGPLTVELGFYVVKPRTTKHYVPDVTPDIDKLARAVLDALKGWIKDDSQVVVCLLWKLYAGELGPGVSIRVVPYGPTA